MGEELRSHFEIAVLEGLYGRQLASIAKVFRYATHRRQSCLGHILRHLELRQLIENGTQDTQSLGENGE